MGWSCCCWLHCAVKGGTDRHGGTARTGCQSFAAATSSVDVIPQPGVTHIIWLIYITPPRGTNIISRRAKAKPCGGGGERREREREREPKQKFELQEDCFSQRKCSRRRDGATLAGLFAPLSPLGYDTMDALKSAGRAIIRSPSMAKQSWGSGRHKSEYPFPEIPVVEGGS